MKNEDELIPNCIQTQEELLCDTSKVDMANHQNSADVTRGGRIRSNCFKVVQTTNDTSKRSATYCVRERRLVLIPLKYYTIAIMAGSEEKIAFKHNKEERSAMKGHPGAYLALLLESVGVC